VPYSCYSKSTRATVPCHISLNWPAFGVFPDNISRLTVAIWRLLIISHLHVHEGVARLRDFPQPVTPRSLLSSPQFPTSSLMSHTHHASTSSNFQQIFDDALEAYKKRTRKDLLTHPLAAQLQDCDSPSSILDLLHQQVQDLNQSQRLNERWTRWLDPTVNVLHAFTKMLEGGVTTLVCLRSGLISAISYIFYRHFHQ